MAMESEAVLGGGVSAHRAQIFRLSQGKIFASVREAELNHSPKLSCHIFPEKNWQAVSAEVSDRDGNPTDLTFTYYSPAHQLKVKS